MEPLEDLPGYGVLMTPAEVSEVTSVALTTLTSNRYEGRGLPFCKLGRSIRYRKADVLSWINANTYRSTAEAKAAE